MSGRYEDDETIPEQWRPRREPELPDDTTRIAPVSPPWSPKPPPSTGRRLPALAGLLVALAVLAGVAIGHDVWGAPSQVAMTAQNGIVGQGVEPSINIPGSAGSAGSPSFGGSSSAGGSASSGGSSSSSGGAGSSTGSPTSSGSGAPANAESIASKVDPALVDINSTFQSEDAKGAGTGIVLTADGEILTNNHVVDLATSISVTDIGNGKTYPATVVGYDSSKDIAVLQLQGASGLQTAKIGDSSTAATGDPVVAIGNAGGTGGTPSTAAGSITALNQSITAGDDLDGSSEQLTGLIQTNADVQPGDSGGSLVNSSGEVIGVDTAASEGFSFRGGASASQGFAIPINQALALASQIESGQGSATVHVGPTAFLGVYISTAGAPQGGQGGGGLGGGGYGGGGYGGGGYGGGGYGGGTSSPTTSGATIAGVVSGGAADKAGLAANDVITSLDGQTVDSAGALTKLIVGLKPGQSVGIGWVDAEGQSHTGTVDLGTGPPA
ncbi:MAG TPA: trypsin-like peptidase domain-containing protein [Solirubrobacteraceae bacterium]